MSKVSELVAEHLGPRGPIVLLYKDKNENTGQEKLIYMLKSITRKNQSYNVIEENSKWFCDCPSFKYRSGVDKEGNCKHILLVTFLLNEDVVINEI